MTQFHHHPDGLVYVRADNGIYVDTLENFATDYGRSAPALPDGMIECIYESGRRHVYFDAKQNAHALEGEAGCAEHEAICAKLDDLLAAQSQRIAAEKAAAAATSTTGTLQL